MQDVGDAGIEGAWHPCCHHLPTCCLHTNDLVSSPTGIIGHKTAIPVDNIPPMHLTSVLPIIAENGSCMLLRTFGLLTFVGVLSRDRPDLDPITELEAQPEDIAEAALMPFKFSQNALPLEIVIQTLRNYKK